MIALMAITRNFYCFGQKTRVRLISSFNDKYYLAIKLQMIFNCHLFFIKPNEGRPSKAGPFGLSN